MKSQTKDLRNKLDQSPSNRACLLKNLRILRKHETEDLRNKLGQSPLNWACLLKKFENLKKP